MIIISHRGNIDGPNKDFENNPIYIEKCNKMGFDVEVDVWLKNNKFYLGHDEPQYEINFEFLKNSNLWCHAKNKDALRSMVKEKEINCFWHQNDDYTLTSKGFIWVYPSIELINNSVAVMPEIASYEIDDLKKCYAICTDNPIYFRNLLFK